MARTTTLRDLVVSLDPDWVRDSRIVREYEFSRRVFIADYTRRGAYDPNVVDFRVTQADELRITEAGDFRFVDGA